jgi:hypothetical protein
LDLLPDILLIVAVGYAIALFSAMTSSQRPPPFRSISATPVPGMTIRPPVPQEAMEAELQALGFLYAGDFDAGTSPKVSTTLRAYLSPDHEILASLISVSTTKETRNVLDLSTSFSPRGSVSTTTSKDPDLFRKPPDHIVVKAPWKTSLADLLGLHVEICTLLARHGRTPTTTEPLMVRQMMIQNQANEFEMLCETGSFRRRDNGAYAMTPRTAFSAVNKLFLRMAVGRFFRQRVKPDGELCAEVERSLQQNVRSA